MPQCTLLGAVRDHKSVSETCRSCIAVKTLKVAANAQGCGARMETMPEHATTTVTKARVRRVPRYGVFLVMGGVLGIITSVILTLAFDGSSEASEIGVTYSQGQVLGFLTLYCAVGGVMIGALVALILDKVVGRRGHDVTIQTEMITED